MKMKDYAADHIFSFLCRTVSGLLVFGLLWLIEIPIVFIFFVEVKKKRSALEMQCFQGLRVSESTQYDKAGAAGVL